MHEYFMSEALKEAKKAELIDEVPIGCVIVYDNKIIARAHNLKETKQNPINHAEILCIQKACKKIKSWRLEKCSIYVTIEPCIMCSGAIIQSRIDNVFFGAFDHKGGGCGSNIDISKIQNINHYPSITSGIMQEECSSIVSNYFKQKRSLKKSKIISNHI